MHMDLGHAQTGIYKRGLALQSLLHRHIDLDCAQNGCFLASSNIKLSSICMHTDLGHPKTGDSSKEIDCTVLRTYVQIMAKHKLVFSTVEISCAYCKRSTGGGNEAMHVDCNVQLNTSG